MSGRGRTGIGWGRAALGLLLALSSGCATILSSGKERVSFTSEPPGATVVVNGLRMGETPFEINLDSTRPQLVEVKLPGYETYQTAISTSVGIGWVVVDLLLTGFPLIIDAITGDWYELTRDQVHAVLSPSGAIAAAPSPPAPAPSPAPPAQPAPAQPAPAQPAPAQPAPEPPPPVRRSRPAPGGPPIVVAVFDIEDPAKRLDRSEAEQLTTYLSARITEVLGYRVVPRAEMRSAIVDQKKDSYQMCFDESCQIELGKALSAQKSISSKLLKVGDTCAMTLTVYDLRSETTERAATTRTACGLDAILGGIDQVTEQLAN